MLQIKKKETGRIMSVLPLGNMKSQYDIFSSFYLANFVKKQFSLITLIFDEFGLPPGLAELCPCVFLATVEYMYIGY